MDSCSVFRKVLEPCSRWNEHILCIFYRSDFLWGKKIIYRKSRKMCNKAKRIRKETSPSSLVLTVSHSMLTSLVFSQNREVRDCGVIFAKYYIRPCSVHTVPAIGLFYFFSTLEHFLLLMQHLTVLNFLSFNFSV